MSYTNLNFTAWQVFDILLDAKGGFKGNQAAISTYAFADAVHKPEVVKTLIEYSMNHLSAPMKWKRFVKKMFSDEGGDNEISREAFVSKLLLTMVRKSRG